MSHRRIDAGVAGLALLLLLALDWSGLDLRLVRLAGDAQGFAWRDHWVLSDLLHDGGRWLALGLLLLLVINLRWPLVKGLSLRQRSVWLLATLACAIAIPAIKQFSLSSCPWDLAEFGGTATYVSHWRWGVADGGAGHCFPSGHAVSAFALLSGWFALRDQRPQLARSWLIAVLLAGMALGTAQMLRGAHYPSHTLWSAWLCWVINALAAQAVPRAAPAHTAAQPPSTAQALQTGSP